MRKRHGTDLGVFQSHGIAGMVVVDDAIHANDFPRHLKPGNLIATVFRGDAGLEETSSDGIQIGESFTIVKKGLAAFDFAPGADHFIDPVELVLCESNRHTQFAHVAIGASDFDSLMIHESDFDIVLCKQLTNVKLAYFGFSFLVDQYQLRKRAQAAQL